MSAVQLGLFATAPIEVIGEDAYLEERYRALLDGRLERWSIGIEERNGKRWWSLSGVSIDVLDESEAVSAAELWYRPRLRPRQRLSIKRAGSPSGSFGWFRPWPIVRAIDLPSPEAE